MADDEHVPLLDGVGQHRTDVRQEGIHLSRGPGHRAVVQIAVKLDDLDARLASRQQLPEPVVANDLVDEKQVVFSPEPHSGQCIVHQRVEIRREDQIEVRGRAQRRQRTVAGGDLRWVSRLQELKQFAIAFVIRIPANHFREAVEIGAVELLVDVGHRADARLGGSAGAKQQHRWQFAADAALANG